MALAAVRAVGLALATVILPALERLAIARPRYLVHGSAVLVGLVTVGIVLAQPRPAGTTAMEHRRAEPPAQTMIDTVPTSAPASTQAAPTAQAAATSAPKPGVHTVEEGESLRMLAAKYGISPATIMAANGLTDPDLIRVGQELVILPTNGVLHRLKAGETLRQVAERYGVETVAIVQANDIGANPDLVVEGSQIIVPGAEPIVQAPAPSTVADAGSEQQAASLPVKPPVPSTRTYEVQPGDTLAGIASTFGVDVSTILTTNGLDDPDMIKPGVELRILPVKGIEYTVQPRETLADIAWKYQVDLGLLLDYNDLDNPDVIRVGSKLVLPGGRLRADAQTAPPAAAPAAQAPAAPKPQAAAPPAVAQVAPKPQAAPAPAPAPAPKPVVGGGGGGVVANAMKYLGYRYVFGGTSPAGFDCSGFVYYVHNVSGSPIGRGMWQQYNGGQHVGRGELLPGDTVFFANTYMPGLSHNGIYIGNGQFIHASDESTGVTISSLNTSYWTSHYVGATRLW